MERNTVRRSWTEEDYRNYGYYTVGTFYRASDILKELEEEKKRSASSDDVPISDAYEQASQKLADDMERQTKTQSQSSESGTPKKKKRLAKKNK